MNRGKEILYRKRYNTEKDIFLYILIYSYVLNYDAVYT